MANEAMDSITGGTLRRRILRYTSRSTPTATRPVIIIAGAKESSITQPKESGPSRLSDIPRAGNMRAVNSSTR